MKEEIEEELKEAKKELINLYIILKPRKLEDVNTQKINYLIIINIVRKHCGNER